MKPKPDPEEQAFLKAIRAKPEARLTRLVYADWLDEHDDPRGELIRIEEEVRTAAIYSDVYWQLKPRRRELLALVEKPWLKQMGYGGTDYQPVFADIPDGWKERWRLLREFVERWYQIPMDDIGGPLKPFPPDSRLASSCDWPDVDTAMSDPKFCSVLPPSLREWVLFVRDVLLALPDFDSGAGNHHRVGEFEGRLYFLQPGNFREVLFVRQEDRRKQDPPVWWDWASSMQPASQRATDASRLIAPHVTTLALHYLLTQYGIDAGEGEFSKQKMTKAFARRLEKCFPVRSHFDTMQVFERPNVLAFWTPESLFSGVSPCFRLLAHTRKAWDEVIDELCE